MQDTAAVSCSPVTPMLGGVGFGFWLTGKPGRAWVGALVGAWHLDLGGLCFEVPEPVTS